VPDFSSGAIALRKLSLYSDRENSAPLAVAVESNQSLGAMLPRKLVIN
jgi:hypothetical protein